MTADLRRLTLEQLRAFVSIADHRSFTNAARLQMRTQAAVTRQIKSMEDILGQRLFRRSRGHVEGLTDAGLKLFPFAQKILGTVDDAWVSLKTPLVSGNIRVGIMDDFDISWLNELLGRFRATHPDCDVRAISDFSARLEQRLEGEEIDVAIIKKLYRDDSTANEGVVRREPLIWVAAPNFRWEVGRPLPLVVFHEGCVYRRHLIDHLKRMGVTAQIVYDGQSYSNVRAAVVAGLGITALAQSQVSAEGLARLKALGGMVLPNLGLVEIVVRHREYRSSPALRAFMREVEWQMLNGPPYARPLRQIDCT